MQVSRLRRALRAGAANDEAEVLVSDAAGYRLLVSPDTLDATRCQARVDAGRQLLAAGRARQARDRFDEALGLWRGPPLADLA